jgi:hypothetical protein
MNRNESAREEVALHHVGMHFFYCCCHHVAHTMSVSFYLKPSGAFTCIFGDDMLVCPPISPSHPTVVLIPSLPRRLLVDQKLQEDHHDWTNGNVTPRRT